MPARSRACPSATPRRATRRGSREKERSPITGLAGFVSTSRTGAKSRSMPQADSSRAIIRPSVSTIAVPFIPATPPCSSSSPIRRMLGQAAQCGGRSRWTRPPSWSMQMSSGPGAADLRVRDNSATCAGSTTFRANRITPPTPRRTRSSSAGVGVVPWIPTNTQRAAWRSNSSISVPRGGEKSVRTLARRDAAGKSACCASGRGAARRVEDRCGRKRLITRQFCCRAGKRRVRFWRSTRPEVCHVRRLLPVVMLALSPLAARGGQSDRDALKKAVEQLLSQPPLSNARVAMQVESLDDGQVIYSRNPDELLNPASNTKLVTAAAGLLRLGPEYRFNTDYLSDKPLNNGRLGTLYVKGRADSSVTTERLDTLVGDLWHRGVRNLGDIVLDDSFFDREECGPGWEQETSDKAWAAGVGALSLNHNAVAIYITPGDRTGARARVEVEPDARDYFIVDNRVVTVRANGRRKLRPHTASEGERTRIVVDGRLPLRAESVVMYRRVGDPAFYYGQTLRALLRKRGIKVTGRVKRGTAPQTASLGIAARDGTMRMRMEGTDAAGRLRAKTGTLERVTALSGYVQSLGGERFVFSVLVNDWAGKSAPVISSIDRLGGLLAALGAPEGGVREAALAAVSTSPQDAAPAELKARVATYSGLAAAADKKNLPFLRSALRTERDPLLRIVLADAVYRSDPDQGGGALLEAMPPSPDLFLRLRSVSKELGLPIPAVSSLLDPAVDGRPRALARPFARAPLARGPDRDEPLAAPLSH